MLSDLRLKVCSIYKSFCMNCNCNLLIPRDESLPDLCRFCNTLICDDCHGISTCLQCKRLVCNQHCIRCHICSKRCCKIKACILDFHICQACQQTFCQEHFDSHKKFNQQEPYKLKCNSEKCRISQGLGPVAVQELSKHLSNIYCLKELRLQNNEMGDSGAKAIALVIPLLPNLEVLYLYKNNISDTGAIELAKALDQITHLAILSLDTNKIADDGALYLANTIIKQKEMKEAYLFFNEIGDKGMIQLLKVFKAHPNLKQVDIRSNHLSSSMIQRIAEWKADMSKVLTLSYR